MSVDRRQNPAPHAWLRLLTSASALAAALTQAPSAEARLADYVNTLRGSNSAPGYSRGNTFPAVTLPFGFNFWTPVTDANSERWLYTYTDAKLNGFAVSHEPSPWIADHGALQIMPMTGTLKVDAGERA